MRSNALITRSSYPVSVYLGWLALFIFPSLFSGCQRVSESRVVIYSFSDRDYEAPILSGYERANQGIELVRKFDKEASANDDLIASAQSESTEPPFDVLWSDEIMSTIHLQKRGLLAARSWPIPRNWPKGFSASDGTWVGVAARGRVLIVNVEQLPDESEWPRRVSELADDKWQRRCGIASPERGTTASHFAVLATHRDTLESDQSDWRAWAEGVARNAVVLVDNQRVADAVSRGELVWGLTDSDLAVAQMEMGSPVQIIFPDQQAGGFGTLLIPSTISILRRARHPIAAAGLADYLISEKVESRLTLSNQALFPIWPTASQGSRLGAGRAIRWAEVDFEKSFEAWERVSESIQTIFKVP